MIANHYTMSQTRGVGYTINTKFDLTTFKPHLYLVRQGDKITVVHWAEECEALLLNNSTASNVRAWLYNNPVDTGLGTTTYTLCHEYICRREDIDQIADQLEKLSL